MTLTILGFFLILAVLVIRDEFLAALQRKDYAAAVKQRIRNETNLLDPLPIPEPQPSRTLMSVPLSSPCRRGDVCQSNRIHRLPVRAAAKHPQGRPCKSME